MCNFNKRVLRYQGRGWFQVGVGFKMGERRERRKEKGEGDKRALKERTVGGHGVCGLLDG